MSRSAPPGNGTARTFPLLSPSPTLTLSRPNEDVWMIELHNGVENRLSRQFLSEAIIPALVSVEDEWRRKTGYGALIIAGNLQQEKFFCNGLIVEELMDDMALFQVLDQALRSLLTFPVPTICAMNGHTFAGGLVLALACDYRVMTSGKAWCCMNEIHFGAPLPAEISALLRVKLPHDGHVRQRAFEGYRFTAQECFATGIVDELAEGGSQGVLSAAIGMCGKVKGGAKTGVWGIIKEEIYSEAIAAIDEGRRVDFKAAKL